jgi:potassium efflux system protein
MTKPQPRAKLWLTTPPENPQGSRLKAPLNYQLKAPTELQLAEVRKGLPVMSLLRPLLLLALLSLCSGAWADAGAKFKFGQELTIPLLQAKIEEAKADADLDERTRNTLIELYLRASSNLEAHADNLASIAKYTTNLDRAVSRILELRADIEVLEQSPVEPLEHLESANQLEIAVALLRARSTRTGIEADVARTQTRLDAARQATPATREELVNAIDEQILSTTDSDTVTLVDESPALKQARRWLRESYDLVRESRVKRLDQDMLHLAPRFVYLKTEIEWQKARLAQQQRIISVLEPLWAQQREEGALHQLASAQATRRDVATGHPLLGRISAENVSIAQTSLHFVRAATALTQEVTELDVQVTGLKEKYNNVRLKLETAGINRSQGRIILERKDDLPNPRILAQSLQAKQALLSEAILEELVAEERLRELSNIPTFVEDRVDAALIGLDSSTVNREDLTNTLSFVAQQQRTFAKSLVSESTYYRQTLNDSIQVQRSLLKTVNTYHNLLAERSLWVRNAPDVNLSTLFDVPDDRMRYFSPFEFHRVYLALIDIIKRYPWVLISLLLALLLWLNRVTLQQRLEKTNQVLRHPLNDSYTCTLRALLITILLAAPGPLILVMFGWGFYLNKYSAGMVAALGPSLRWLAVNWFVIALFYQICRPDGLGAQHFGWRESVLQILRRKLVIFMFAYLPLGFVVFFLITLDPSALEWEYVRVGLIALFVIIGGFFLNILHRSGELMIELVQLKTPVPLVSLRWLWLTLATLIPLFLVILVALGYVYTATTLFNCLLQSIALMLLIVLCHQLGMRWLHVATRRLLSQSMQDELPTRLSADGYQPQRNAGRVHYEVPDVDLAEISRDSSKLLGTAIFIVGVLGFLLVWYPILPALGYLENIQLWSVTKTVGGAELIDTISLADLLFCLLIIGFSYALYQNLPALLKLFFIQVLSLSPSAHYTAINLILYVIILVSFFTVAHILGFEWAKFQWLLAALGVGIGFGLQEVVANFISGFIILLERPIRVGDLVTVGEVEGFVTRIRLRATTVLTLDRQELLVPNKTFISDNLLNWSLSDQITRLTVDVGVAYDSDVDRAMEVMVEVAQANEDVIRDPKPFVTVEAFGDNALHLRLLCFIDDIEARINARSNLHKAVFHRLQQEGIVIAFPQMDLHFDAEREVTIKLEPQRV